jgi:hypothetical protein
MCVCVWCGGVWCVCCVLLFVLFLFFIIIICVVVIYSVREKSLTLLYEETERHS